MAKSVITFYRLPKSATTDGCETAWAAVTDPSQLVSSIPLVLAPDRALMTVMGWLNDPKDDFNYVVEEQVTKGANFLFVMSEHGKPIMGVPV